MHNALQINSLRQLVTPESQNATVHIGDVRRERNRARTKHRDSFEAFLADMGERSAI